MSRKPAGSAGAGTMGSVRLRDPRLAGVVIAMLLILVAPASASAGPHGGSPSLAINIDVTSRDCQAVNIDYVIEWEGLTPDSAANPSTIVLRTSPDSFTLAGSTLDFGKKADKSKGKVRGEIVRESGYFDHQTYPASSYEVIVRNSDGTIDATSNTIAIPACVPLSPQSGPASGGTLITIVGGGTFGGPGFTLASTVTIGGAITVSPTEVAPDGTWLRFLAPPGPAGSCVSVWTDPSLPFLLPDFCYGA